MSNATREQETVELDDLEEEEAETPLTPEAIVHLRAAAREVSESYGDIHALLDTVERALSEPTGGEKTLSEEERMNLARLVAQARDKADHGMQRPIFERGRGDRPHGEIREESGEGSGSGPVDHLTQHDRGIFRQHYGDPQGNEILVAVDSRGREVARASVPEGTDRSGIIAALRSVLAAADPEEG